MLSRYFIVVAVIFWSMIHFGVFLFVFGIVYDCLIVLIPFIDEIILSLFRNIGIFAESQ